MAYALPCPVCASGILHVLDKKASEVVACDSCGHEASSEYAREAAWLSEQMTAIQTRFDWVLAQVSSGTAPTKEAPAYAVPGAAREKISSAQPGMSAQQVLLSLGGLSLAVAGVVFVAFLWSRVDALGQAALLVVVTLALLIGGSVLLKKERLRSTGVTLFVVGSVLAAVNVLFVAPLGGIGAQWWVSEASTSNYPTIAMALLGGAFLVVGRILRSSLWSSVGVIMVSGGAWLWLALLVWGASFSSALAWLPFLAFVLACASLFAKRSTNHLVRLAAINGFILATGILSLSIFAPEAWLAWLIVLAASAVLSQVMSRRSVEPSRAWAIIATVTTSAVVPWGLMSFAVVDDPRSFYVALILSASASVAFLVFPALLPRKVLGLQVGPFPEGVAARFLALFSALVALLIGFFELGGVLPSDEGAFASFTNAVSVLLAVVGFGFYLSAWVPPRIRGAEWIAACLLVLPTIVLLDAIYGTRDVWVEAWSLPLAALFAVAGATHAYFASSASSWQTMMPAIVVALAPSTLSVMSGWRADDGWRFVGVSTVVVLLMIMGSRYRLGGVLVPASVAFGFILLAQLWHVQELFPRWVVFATLGVVLVAAGARVEWLRGKQRAARGWVGSLR